MQLKVCSSPDLALTTPLLTRVIAQLLKPQVWVASRWRHLRRLLNLWEAPADATNNSRRMQAITLGGNPAFTLPALNFAPTAAGIDACKVTDRGILPVINTGIAHKQAGVGQIGAGITTAPMACLSLLYVNWRRSSQRRTIMVKATGCRRGWRQCAHSGR